jgi:serine/threonine-protein kinase RsbT
MKEGSPDQLPVQVPISGEWDVAVAVKKARELARREGLPQAAVEALATAVSEVVRNIVVHGGKGELVLKCADGDGRRGVVAIGRDEGPGIPDLEKALQDGYSTAGSLGFGLSGARRLVDQFEIVSGVGTGTTVTMTKWAPR